MRPMSEPPQAPGLVPAPAAIVDEISAWTRSLQQAAGSAFRALYVHGSALTERFDPQASDVNLLLVVDELGAERLDALARACAAEIARSKRRVTPLVLSREQIEHSTDVFPLEFSDLARRRALVAGEDVLASLDIDARNLRHQCESELRAKLVGLRQAYLTAGGAPAKVHELLRRAAGGTAAAYRGLLLLRGAEPPHDPEALVAAVARTYAVDATALAAPFAARRESGATDAVKARFADYVGALESLIRAVDALRL